MVLPGAGGPDNGDSCDEDDPRNDAVLGGVCGEVGVCVPLDNVGGEATRDREMGVRGLVDWKNE